MLSTIQDSEAQQPHGRARRRRRSCSSKNSLNPKPSERLSAKIAQYVLASKKLTQKELAKKLGVQQGYISKVTRGEKNFTLSHLELLSSFLNIPVAVLVWKACASKPPRSKARRKLFENMNRLVSDLYPDCFKVA